jgi:hypothetical protein
MNLFNDRTIQSQRSQRLLDSYSIRTPNDERIRAEQYERLYQFTRVSPWAFSTLTTITLTLRVPYIPWISAFCTTILSSYHYGASLSDRVVQARRRAQTIELERLYRRRSEARQGVNGKNRNYTICSLYGVSPVRGSNSID